MANVVKKQVSFLNNAIDEAIKIINAMKSEPWGYVFSVFYVPMQEVGMIHPCHTLRNNGCLKVWKQVLSILNYLSFNNLLTLFC